MLSLYEVWGNRRSIEVVIRERHSAWPKGVTDYVIAIIITADTCDNHIDVITVGCEGHFIFVGMLHNVKTDYS